MSADTDFPVVLPNFRYRVLANRSAGVAPRVLELFAKRDLVPLRFESRAAGERLTIDVEIADLDPGAARHIARCLAATVDVERVAFIAEAAPADSAADSVPSAEPAALRAFA